MGPSSKLKDSRSTLVDAYIAKAAPFAQPILWHVRELVHKAAPGVEEVIKWSRPFFMYRGIILGNMSAFKAHCSFGLWDGKLIAKMRADGVVSDEGMGTFGRLETLKDLPDDKKLLAYIKQATAAIDDGTRTKNYTRPPRAAKPELEVPADLAAALKKNKAAQKAFDAFAPSHRREYIAWITEAKRDETRASRVTQTVDWLAEGKRRNWKYENC
jgi:hypothetical protein